MISARLVDVAWCPECRVSIAPVPGAARLRCPHCAREFAADHGFLDLRPVTAFAEQTKYLDEALHSDARHEAIAPPLLGSKVRNDMLRRFLALTPADRVIDLGCGNGRALAWNADTGASLAGIDISPYFAEEARERSDLLLGDLRRLPLRDGAFTRAWSLDVLEHLSPEALRDMLSEANRVLADNGTMFVYTHVRKNGWVAGGTRLVNRLARWCEHLGLLDLRQERLRKSDHLNPIADHDDLRRVLAECGFRLERVTYYTPIIGAFTENILARIVEQRLARRARRRDASVTDGATAVRHARRSAQAVVGRRGWTYRALRVASALMMLDVVLLGRIQSGPFFALLRKIGPAPHAAATAPGAAATSPAASAPGAR